MKEANQFEDWTNQIMEGTWALPETAEDMARLQELMSKPLPCGPDGEYASEQLYSLIGDDSLFDDIGELADKDPDADCRELVKARAQQLGVDIDVEVGESVNEDVSIGDHVKVKGQDIEGKVIADHGNMVVIRDEDAETDDDELEFRKSDLVLSKSINENPTDQETASGYQAGQANAAAGKERSLEMGLGGQDVVKTAGGSDIEEAEEELSMCCDAPISDGDGDAEGRCTSCGEVVRVEEGIDSFVNPNDQDATRSKTNVPTKNLDSEDMTENRLSREELDIDDDAIANLMSADELRKELIDDLNHLYDQASANDFTDTDHIIDEMGDYFNDIHINGDDDVVEVYAMARDLADAEPAEVIQFTERGIKALGGIIEDAAMSDLLRLAGQGGVEETQDVDTGKQALKAERDPMLERMLNIVNR